MVQSNNSDIAWVGDIVHDGEVYWTDKIEKVTRIKKRAQRARFFKIFFLAEAYFASGVVEAVVAFSSLIFLELSSNSWFNLVN